MIDWGLLGILAVMMCPMVFGAIAFIYSHKYTEEVTKEWWSKFDKCKEAVEREISSMRLQLVK